MGMASEESKVTLEVAQSINGCEIVVYRVVKQKWLPQ